MLNTKIVNGLEEPVEHSTNIYDVIIAALNSRSELARAYMISTDTRFVERGKEQLEKVDEHIKMFRLMATDYYDSEEEA